MSFRAINELPLSITVAVGAATAKKTPWFKFPRAGTIKAAYMGSSSGVITANTTVAYAPALMNGGTAGTSTLTIATFGSLATPYVQTANQQYAASWPDTTLKDFAEGQWAVLDEEMTGAPTAGNVTVCAHVVTGTGRVS
jgi:hypothetical protein